MAVQGNISTLSNLDSRRANCKYYANFGFWVQGFGFEGVGCSRIVIVQISGLEVGDKSSRYKLQGLWPPSTVQKHALPQNHDFCEDPCGLIEFLLQAIAVATAQALVVVAAAVVLLIVVVVVVAVAVAIVVVVAVAVVVVVVVV